MLRHRPFTPNPILLVALVLLATEPAHGARKATSKAASRAAPAARKAAPARRTAPRAAAASNEPAPVSQSSVWKAEVPAQMKESGVWMELAHAMLDQGLNYGALATAARMRVFFQDLATKEVAYQAMVAVIDRGYPFPIYEYFMGADLEPTEPYGFANSFNLYKSVLSKQKGMSRWADHYLERVDTVHFRKYQLLKALEAYQKDNLKDSEESLSKILGADLGPDELPLLRKATRTLARIFFERADYEKSLNVYNEFLLNLNPVSPNDWLEAAWSYYHLKKFDQALGMLYNLESEAIDPTINLEKFNIRALIYRDQCALTNMESLVQDFDRVFGKVIDGIKQGENLMSFPILRSIEIPGNQLFNRINITLANLKEESALTEKVPPKLRSAADYIFRTEMRMLSQQMRSVQEAAVQNAANQLILVSEQLRFLKFDSQRAKYNPENVFKAPESETKKGGSTTFTERPEDSYELRWIQFGDFWRDERLKYRGVLPNLCSS